MIKLLEKCRQPETMTNLMKILRWKNRTKFRQKYINPLLGENLITMTIPERPQSRMQKYLITKLGLKVLSELYGL